MSFEKINTWSLGATFANKTTEESLNLIKTMTVRVLIYCISEHSERTVHFG